MISITNLKTTQTEDYYTQSATFVVTPEGEDRAEIYFVSGVEWTMPNMHNVHEVMVFAYRMDGTIDYSGLYTERYTTDIVRVFHNYLNRERP